MRRFDGTGRTGRTGGASKAAQIECDDERFAFDTGEGDVGRVWSAGRIAAVEASIWDASEEAALEIIAEIADAAGVLFKRAAGEVGGVAEADDPGYVFGGGAEAAPMPTAVAVLAHGSAPPH